MQRFEQMLEQTSVQRSSVDAYVVGGASDASERRADQMADRGLDLLRAGEAHAPQAAAASPVASSRIQRAATSVGAAGGPVDSEVATTLDAAIGHGRPFAPVVQQRIQRAIGHDVSSAHVHTDARADHLARSVNARAFTVADNVFFARGEFRPDTQDGMHTVLHESAHLAEGAGGVQRQTIQRKISVTSAVLDASFDHETGARGLAKKLGSDEIPKIREALKKYHSADKVKHNDKALARYKKTIDKAESDPQSFKRIQVTQRALTELQDATATHPQQMAALQTLMKYADDWLRKHPQARDDQERARIVMIDSIRTEAGVEYGKAQAEAVYVGDGRTGRKDFSAPKPPKRGPGSNPLNKLKGDKAFKNPSLYERRNDTSDPLVGAGRAVAVRDELVASGELQAHDPVAEARLRAGIDSLSKAEFAGVNTYTGPDYEVINPNVSGRAKDDKEAMDQSGLHGAFIAQAFQKLPIWKGKTYKGMVFEADYLNLAGGSVYKANDFWSTSEARSIAKNFVQLTSMRDAKRNRAAICTVEVCNGRDVSRVSDAPAELEILLPAGSSFVFGKRRCLTRGKDDAEIEANFGAGILRARSHLTEFWLIEMKQVFSKDSDGIGAYGRSGTYTAPKKPTGARKDVQPWEKMGGSKMLSPTNNAKWT